MYRFITDVVRRRFITIRKTFRKEHFAMIYTNVQMHHCILA